MRFEPVICLPTAWSSVFMQFVLHLFEGHVSLADMDRIQQLAARWELEHPGKRVEMVVVFPSDARMSPEERARMAQLIKRGEQQRIASATVILAQGLLASVQRSVLTGMMLLAPSPHPAKVFASTAEALRWLFPHLRELCGRELELDDLVVALSAHVAMFRTRADRPQSP
jgi:hypothetical protein